MIGRTVRRARAGGLTLLLMCSAASILLLTGAFGAAASEEVADATPFGRTGTVVVTIGAAVVVCAAAAVAWRTAWSRTRAAVAGLSIIAAVLVATMAFFFLFADPAQVSLGLLLTCAAVLIALGGREAAQASATGEGR